MARIDGTNSNNTLNGFNNQNDEIYGYDGDDTLNGRGGADTLYGGTGNDVYIIDQLDTLVELAGEGIDEVRANFSYTLLENFENLRLTGSANINGTGNSANNEIWGNSGANVLDGAGGSDILRGGAGNDVYIVDGGDQVFEGGNNGIDEVRSSATFTLGNNVENLTLTGSANINGTGNSASNVISGNDGDNVLNGGNGVDTLQMTRATTGVNYYVSANLTTGTMTGHGNDTILNFENVIGTALGDGITGNAGNNVLDGAGGSDDFFVTNGVDTIIGGDGNDGLRFDNTGAATADLSAGTYSLDANNYGTASSVNHVIGSAFGDSLTGNNDTNHMGGGAGDDYMIGGGGNDQIWGGAGNDRLVADLGSDTLNGNNSYLFGADGAGADIFEIRTGAQNVTINDFEVGIDKLDLTAFGFNSQGVSAYWTASATYDVPNANLKLTGQQGEIVNICLQGVTHTEGFSVNDMIGGSASLVPPAPQYPVNGGNGVADVFLIDPVAIMNGGGTLDIFGFEDGLDVLDLRPLDLMNGTWDGWVYDYGPNDQARLEFWDANSNQIAINLVGQSYFLMDMSDYII
jgi:Ca2+-binding RTX toxin-like protein